MVVISCPNCLTKFKVRPDPESSARFIKCAACAHVFVVSPDTMKASGKGPDEKTSEFLPELSFIESPAGGEAEAENFTALQTAPVSGGDADGKRRGKQGLLVHASGEQLEIDKFQTTFGRRNADITLDDPDVSRQHAVIERYDEKFLLKDLESTNGTYLNGQRITIDFLKDGDVIRMGKTVLRFQLH